MDNPSFRFHLPELETFLVVLEEGQFSKAAERLCISQPTASSRVKKLESVLRVQLLVRTTRSVEPTEEGRLLQAAATDALSGLYDVLRQFRGRSEAAQSRRGGRDADDRRNLPAANHPFLLRALSRRECPVEGHAV
jgi:DNA-binding transcriptional LysR family regulator